MDKMKAEMTALLKVGVTAVTRVEVKAETMDSSTVGMRAVAKAVY